MNNENYVSDLKARKKARLEKIALLLLANNKVTPEIAIHSAREFIRVFDKETKDD